MAAQALPYQVEYAKTGRASCRLCKSSIDKDSLRIAVMVQSRHHDGKDAHWFHQDCFFQKHKPSTVGDLANFENIRWNDQEQLTKLINGGPGGASKSASNGSAKVVGEYSCEYAKSSRSQCAGCEEMIAKGITRISKLDHESDSALLLSRAIPRWYHVTCFVKLAPQLGFTAVPNKIPGFKSLENADQQAMLSEFKDSLVSGKRKLSADTAAGPSKPAKSSKPEPGQTLLKKQMNNMYAIRDKLQGGLKSGILKMKDLKDFLEHNKQQLPEPCGEQVVLERISDIMTFGRLDPCAVCKKGQYTYVSGVGYQCNGYLNEFTKCLNSTKSPLRKKTGIPPELEDYMKSIKYKFIAVEERIIPEHVAPTAAAGRPSLFPKLNKKPLEGFKFVLSGEEFKNVENLQSIITKYGGKLTKTVNGNTTAVVGVPDPKTKKLKDLPAEKKAEKLKIPVLSAAFVEGVSEVVDIVELMKNTLLSTYFKPEDIKSRLLSQNESFEKPRSSSSGFEKRLETKEKTTIVQLKGGCVVDNDCEVANETHVFKDRSGLVYNAVLNNSNVDTGKNAYYKLQLLETDHGKKYYVFRSYGRIGTTIGKKMTSHQMDLEEALEMFNNVFQLQTGNKFGSPFVKKPGMYMLLDVHYEDEAKKCVKTTSKSSLKLAIQELICLIFDVEKMKQTMLEFELDLEKLPLGKISRKQILDAYAILSETSKILDKTDATSVDRRLVDVTNRFFTLIPHNFGLSQPPVLKDETMIKDKMSMLESLMEIELAYELLREGDTKEGEPVDAHYASLNARIKPVHSTTVPYQIILKYLNWTHAETHQQYGLEIQDVFKVERMGESEKYEKFQNLHNKKLLWHGSRTTNFAGILSQGLRIAPPEAPVTGYMFGKGVYFADMVSKSANYCYTSKNGTGLLLLCEVALGDMHELTAANENLKAAPAGKHSVKGIGQTAPDPKVFDFLGENVLVPCGKPVKTKTKSDLLYNEYIVYNTSQIKIRYVVRVKFTAPTRR